MSGAVPNDLLDFYQNFIGNSRKLAVTDSAVATFSDANGPLEPGKWLVFLRAASTNFVWVASRVFVKGAAPSAVAADVPARPMSPDLGQDGLSFFLHVRKGVNDQFVAIAETGKSGTLYFVHLSQLANAEIKK